jgi:hypothetical protein
MSFLGGTKVLLHAEMRLLTAALKPDASSGCERFGLCDLRKAENAAIERSRRRLLSCGMATWT